MYDEDHLDGLDRYRKYVDDIVEKLSKHTQPVAVIVEPDALTGLAAFSTKGKCSSKFTRRAYVEGIRHALNKLTQAGEHISVYVSGGSSELINNSSKQYTLANILREILDNEETTKRVQGLAVNVGGYASLREEGVHNFLGKAKDKDKAFLKVRGTSLYDWNIAFDELTYVAHMNRVLMNVFGRKFHFMIDTSRNGWKTSREMNGFVVHDGRNKRSSRTNVLGAGLGLRPAVAPQLSLTPFSYSELPNKPHLELPVIDALYYVTPPGRSDGEDGNSDSLDNAPPEGELFLRTPRSAGKKCYPSS